jgi:transcriptional regulator of met regulon
MAEKKTISNEINESINEMREKGAEMQKLLCEEFLKAKNGEATPNESKALLRKSRKLLAEMKKQTKELERQIKNNSTKSV